MAPGMVEYGVGSGSVLYVVELISLQCSYFRTVMS